MILKLDTDTKKCSGSVYYTALFYFLQPLKDNTYLNLLPMDANIRVECYV